MTLRERSFKCGSCCKRWIVFGEQPAVCCPFCASAYIFPVTRSDGHPPGEADGRTGASR